MGGADLLTPDDDKGGGKDPGVPDDELANTVAAQAGDQDAFARLVGPHRRGLHLHCYRMLGQLQDADDALQESLLRTWKGLPGFTPRAPFRAWLYQIATNVCLTMLAARSAETRRRVAIDELYGRIGPYPERALHEIPATPPGPDLVAEERETVELAFIAAVQLLPARQRAVLLLRDVLDFSASDVAGLLDTTVAAVNSTLQRARVAVERDREVAHLTRRHAPASEPVERALVQRFVGAWRAADFTGLVRLLVDDAVLTMPPQSLRVTGRNEVAAFLVTAPAGGQLDQLQLVETRANGQPALAVYLHDAPSGESHPYAVMVLSMQNEAISAICRFDPSDLFPRLGLPALLADEA